jgi:phosphoadenosine phosphosulfate reductase
MNPPTPRRIFFYTHRKPKDRLMTLPVIEESAPAREVENAVGENVVQHITPGSRPIDELNACYAGLDGIELLRPLIECEFDGRLAAVSSFGAESAVLLALVAEIDRRTPVLFLDTGKLFGETLCYRDLLVARLGLVDVRTLTPDQSELAAADPRGNLWLSDPDRCCAARKIAPLAGGLAGFDAWVSGHKHYHGGVRGGLPVFEKDGHGRTKINPLAEWSRRRLASEFIARNLPRHPLEALGYLSIGCFTCTDQVRPGEALRAGRWRGLAKTECGIHRI